MTEGKDWRCRTTFSRHSNIHGRLRTARNWGLAVAVPHKQMYETVFGLLTQVLNPRGSVIPEKSTDSQLVKIFPAFYGTRRIIVAFG